MEFKRGMYIIYEGNSVHRHIYGHVPAMHLLNGNPTASVIGYSRIGGNVNANYYFRDDQGHFTDFSDISKAEEYVYLRGWDDVSDQTLGNYSLIPNRSYFYPFVPATPLPTTYGAPVSFVYDPFDNTEEMIVNSKIGISEKPKCDCGGDKCKLPHHSWCSVYKEPV